MWTFGIAGKIWTQLRRDVHVSEEVGAAVIRPASECPQSGSCALQLRSDRTRDEVSCQGCGCLTQR
jgi:hypothetical protein